MSEKTLKQFAKAIRSTSQNRAVAQKQISELVKLYESQGVNRSELISQLKKRTTAAVARLAWASPVPESAQKNLVLGVIAQAVEDINNDDEAESARRFIDGQWFDYYAGLLEIDPAYARSVVNDLTQTPKGEAA